jgi:hypothetical protein
MIATTMREQARRESNGTKHRETMAINIECAQDNPRKRNYGPSVDKENCADIVRARNVRVAHDVIRAQFGPRLVRKDGSALYRFQCKK